MISFKNYDGEEAAEVTAELVQIESTDPGKYEGEVALYLEELITAELEKYRKCLCEKSIETDHLLFNSVRLEREAVADGRYNLIFNIDGNNEELPKMVILCHMDTVVVGDGWESEALAFSGKIEEGRLYGRGAADMKSGLACALTAVMHELQQIAIADKLPEHGIKLVLTVDEEDYMRGSGKLLEDKIVRNIDYLLDTEPTDGMVQNCHKGRSWFRVDINGITAHASMPWEGADAIYAASLFITSLKAEVDKLESDAVMGKTSIVFGTIEGGYRPYVVPDHASFTIDVRTVPPCNTAKLEELIKNISRDIENEIKGIKIQYEITGDRDGVKPVADSKLLMKMKTAIELCGYEFKTSVFPGYTDSAVIGSVLGNKDCMSYGPGMLGLAHKPNEYVELKDIYRVTEVLKKLLEGLRNN
ncbi:MAG: M20 family metallopeptidase [Eubacteriales bacterium]|nr:M20 family metallopeptidase [Eubacteriales bacterium]